MDPVPGLPFNERRNAGGVFGHRRRLAEDIGQGSAMTQDLITLHWQVDWI